MRKRAGPAGPRVIELDPLDKRASEHEATRWLNGVLGRTGARAGRLDGVALQSRVAFGGRQRASDSGGQLLSVRLIGED
jgi:hypothetical protein